MSASEESRSGSASKRQKVDHLDDDENDVEEVKPDVITADGDRQWLVDGKVAFVIRKTGEKIWYMKDGQIGRTDDKPAIITKDGAKIWYIDGRLGRKGDKPAVITKHGMKVYVIKGVNEPTVVTADGERVTYFGGNLGGRWGVIGREGDEPAFIGEDGERRWYVMGKPGRIGDKPCYIKADGTMVWSIDGELGRAGGKPAVIYRNGKRQWYLKGLLHRDFYQPAVIDESGNEEWFEHGVKLPAKPVWHPAVEGLHGTSIHRPAWTQESGCPVCYRAFSSECRPAIICAVNDHALCLECLKPFMDSVNGYSRPEPSKPPKPVSVKIRAGCPLCTRPLVQTILVLSKD